MTTKLKTELISGSAPKLVLAEAEIRVIAGPDQGQELKLGLQSVEIGSSGSCGFVLHDQTVSSRHAVIEVTPKGYVLRDLGSKNGMRVGGVEVLAVPLSGGLKIELGNTILFVKDLGSSQEIELGQPRQLGPLQAYSTKMRAVASAIERLAKTDITVLLEGETGTGKEVAAQALHQASPRRDAPFVVFDCGAQSPELICAELFGHERGAFTGAEMTRDGAIGAADGGTLFLDEIGELPLDMQPMLLRVLESRESRRVGSNEVNRHNVRIVAATNRNLAEEVRAGRFREDLMYRLAVAQVRLPPLRERVEDIPRLAQVFADEVGAVLTPEIMAILTAHDWPGNVRELRHVVSRAAVLGDCDLIAPQLPRGPMPLPEARRAAVDDFERLYVRQVLTLSNGNVTKASDIAGVSRQMLTRLIAKHQLRRSSAA